MKIVKLEASNIKRLRAVTIEPDGSVVVIGGKNGAGKSSLLDSIAYAMAGGRALPDEPLRKGASKGRVRLELDDGLVVTRVFGRGGSTQLKVEVEGEQQKSPQAILDQLFGQLSFDPLAFTRMSDRDRLEMLQGMVSAEDQAKLEGLHGVRQTAYEDRTEVGRDVRRLTAGLEGHGLGHENEEQVDVAALTHELGAIDEMAQEAREAEDNARNLREGMARLQVVKDEGESVITRMEEELAREKKSYEEHGVKLAHVTREHEIALVRAGKKAGELARGPERGDVMERMRQADEQNRTAREASSRNAERLSLSKAEHAQSALTSTIEDCDEQREAILESTQLPVEGLTFDEETGVRMNGVPWDQASSAEQLRVSVAMGLALNPKLKVLLVRDGSLLDEDSLRLMAEMAESADGQVFLEVVGDRDDAAVIIEDGHVASGEAMDAA